MPKHVEDNRDMYNTGDLERTKDRLAFEIFPVRVLSADYERHVLTVQDYKDGLTYTEVAIFPANYSAMETTDVTMPEQGAVGLACNWQYESGFRQVAVIAWVHSQAKIAVDNISQRAITSVKIQGHSDRIRGSYRKAFPGQKTAVYKGGFSEKIDAGWDKQAADWSRDKLDSDRRTWTQITNRRVSMTGSGIVYQGPINRPNAPNLQPTMLPDGTQEFVSYLQPGATLASRYTSGQQDVIPFAENTQFTQEYSLDYIPPMEAIQTTILDTLLGTTANPWNRTTVTTATGGVSYDNETYMSQQTSDHPTDPSPQAPKVVGPTTGEAPTPLRRGFIVEKSEGTLVGYNRFDPGTYGKVLKPILFTPQPGSSTGSGAGVTGWLANSSGRFGANIQSGYVAVVDTADHSQARLAASCMAIRFPYEYNTTRLDVTKEGFTSLEIGATLPKENIPIDSGSYEHPHGAGRSLEAHLVGSAKLVVGKNRDEEEAVDLQALGQTVIRLGADDTSLPDARRDVETQQRGQNDLVAKRTLQYWSKGGIYLSPGDSGVDANGYGKKGGESVSLRAAMDGAAIMRLGARNPASMRRHLVNGYKDGQGRQPWGVADASRVDSHSPGRPNYGAGDTGDSTTSKYAFNDLTQAGKPTLSFLTSGWSGTPVPGGAGLSSSPMDQHGLSLDFHAVRDMLVRVGANPASGQSILLDTDGGLVVGLGADNQGRSVTASLNGGCEITIKPNKQNKALRIEIIGDVDITHQGHLQYFCSGDIVTECTTRSQITKTDNISVQQKAVIMSLARTTLEAPDIIHNQGSQVPVDPGNENS